MRLTIAEKHTLYNNLTAVLKLIDPSVMRTNLSVIGQLQDFLDKKLKPLIDDGRSRSWSDERKIKSGEAIARTADYRRSHEFFLISARNGSDISIVGWDHLCAYTGLREATLRSYFTNSNGSIPLTLHDDVVTVIRQPPGERVIATDQDREMCAKWLAEWRQSRKKY